MPDLKRTERLEEEEDLRMKRMVVRRMIADLGLDYTGAQGRHRNARKALMPVAKRKAAGWFREARQLANGESATC